MATTVEQLGTALASAYPLIVVLSPEEDRIERLIQRFAAGGQAAAAAGVTWNCRRRVPRARRGDAMPPRRSPGWPREAPRGFYVFKDMHALLPGNRALLRRAARHRGGDPQHAAASSSCSPPSSSSPTSSSR